MSQLPPADQLYSYTEISAALDRMALAINARCSDGEWLVICVLQGGLMLTGELLRRFNFVLKLDQLKVSRYAETTQGQALVWHSKPASELQGQKILLLDDIFDEGVTLATLAADCEAAGADVVLTAVLIDKHNDRKKTDYRPDFVGLSCPDRYLFGFGMDYQGYWRNLPNICALR